MISIILLQTHLWEPSGWCFLCPAQDACLTSSVVPRSNRRSTLRGCYCIPLCTAWLCEMEEIGTPTPHRCVTMGKHTDVSPWAPLQRHPHHQAAHTTTYLLHTHTHTPYTDTEVSSLLHTTYYRRLISHSHTSNRSEHCAHFNTLSCTTYMHDSSTCFRV